jgi:hypothetical protein
MAFDPETVHDMVQRIRSEEIEIPDKGRFINAYELTLSYGGPEEGGWWYPCYVPLASMLAINPLQAIASLEYLLETYGEFYKSSREYTSAAGGADLLISIEEKPAEASPTERPHYE